MVYTFTKNKIHRMHKEEQHKYRKKQYVSNIIVFNIYLFIYDA